MYDEYFEWFARRVLAHCLAWDTTMTSWPCSVYILAYTYICGQIIATSHDLTPNSRLVREFPLFQGHLGWWNIIIWPDIYIYIYIYRYIYIYSHWLLVAACHCGIFRGRSWPPPRINAAHDQLRVWGSQELHAVGIYWTWNACFPRRQKMMERLCYGTCDACKTGCSGTCTFLILG